MNEGQVTEAEALRTQIAAILAVVEKGEREFLEMAAAQKDIGDKGNMFSLGWSQGAVEAADYFRWIREQWIEGY